VWRSYLVIVCLEIGDRTFFIAALMSAKHPAATVFAGAFGALLVMTVLSTALGVAAPMLLPRSFTHYAGAGLFLFFGVQMLAKAARTDAGAGGASEELEEVEGELKARPRGESCAAVAHALLCFCAADVARAGRMRTRASSTAPGRATCRPSCCKPSS
jgi:putative Ca2+/H+ antiporter (TMEM165/GDT1 family)